MKIFFDDRILQLLKPEELYNGHIILPGSLEELKPIIETFDKDSSLPELALSSPDYKQLKRDVLSLFTIVKAAGGLVQNKEGEILFIYRRGKWDLPKGKIEPGTSKSKKQKAKGEKRKAKNEHRQLEAVREVKEETGLLEVKVIREIKPSYHVYYAKGQPMLKKTWWFEMIASRHQILIPQTDEDILYVRWFRPEELGTVLENTFGSLKEMITNHCTSLPPLP